MRLSSTQVKICQIPYVSFETRSGFLSKFCIPLQFHERQLLCNVLVQTIYTLLKRSPLKWKFFKLSSVQVKICQIPYINFETTSRFLFQILYPSSVSWNITPLYFFSSNNLLFAQKEPIKVNIFETFECSGQNLSNSFFQNIPYSWKITPLYF